MKLRVVSLSKLRVVSLSVAALLLAACSDNTTTNMVYTEYSGFNQLEPGKSLPTCSSDREGALYYAADSLALFCCAGGSWNKLNVSTSADTVRVTDTVVTETHGVDTVYFSLSDVFPAECVITPDTLDLHNVFVTCGASTFAVNEPNARYRVTKYGDDLVDPRDGERYKTVIIGSQTWMAENLRYATDEIRDYCYKEDRYRNIDSVGMCYAWYAAMGSPADCTMPGLCNFDGPVQGVCPDGWHIPSQEEWQVMFDYVDAHNGDTPVGRDLNPVGATENVPSGYDLFGFSILESAILSSTQVDDSTHIDVARWFNSDLRNKSLFFEAVSYRSNERYGYNTVRCLKN